MYVSRYGNEPVVITRFERNERPKTNNSEDSVINADHFVNNVAAATLIGTTGAGILGTGYAMKNPGEVSNFITKHCNFLKEPAKDIYKGIKWIGGHAAEVKKGLLEKSEKYLPTLSEKLGSLKEGAGKILTKIPTKYKAAAVAVASLITLSGAYHSGKITQKQEDGVG